MNSITWSQINVPLPSNTEALSGKNFLEIAKKCMLIVNCNVICKSDGKFFMTAEILDPDLCYDEAEVVVQCWTSKKSETNFFDSSNFIRNWFQTSFPSLLIETYSSVYEFMNISEWNFTYFRLKYIILNGFLTHVSEPVVQGEKKSDGLYYLIQNVTLASYASSLKCCRHIPGFRMAIARTSETFQILVDYQATQNCKFF